MDGGRGHNVFNRMKYMLLMIALVSLLWMTQAIPAIATEAEGSNTAGDKLHIDVEVGYNGQYVFGKSAPVQFTVTNHDDRDLKGELVLNLENHRGLSVAHILPLEVTKGSTVEAYMTVAGNLTQNETLIQFYEGGVDRGQLLDTTGVKHAIGQSVATATTIGIAANDPDTLNFVAFLNNQGFSITPIVLDADFYAESMNDLSMFTFLVLNDISTAEWSEQKVKAIKDWVANGGTLLFGGGAGYEQTAAAFAEIVPVEGRDTKLWEQATELSDYVGVTEPLQPLPVINGRLIKGDTIVQDGGIPLTAVARFGHGSVYYTAFDLGLKPFSTWDGRTAFIQSLLSEQLMLAGTVNRPDMWAMENSSNYFPRLHPPEVAALLIIFFIYILIVAPILYVVLKRVDRREWSWWVIPLTAVLSTIIIVVIGSRDKSSLYVNGIRVAMIDEGAVRETGVNNIFIPNSKDVVMELPEHVNPTIMTGNTNAGSEVSTNKQQRVYHHTPSKEVMFTNNKYWTMKSTLLEEQIYNAEQYGSITVDIEAVDDQDNMMTVYNETGVDLNHVSLVAYSRLYYIDHLPAGESLEYRLPRAISSNGFANMNAYHNNYGSSLSQGSGKGWDELSRETYLLDNTPFSYAAMIIAFSYKEDEAGYVVNNKSVKNDELKMWVVNIEQQLSEGIWAQQMIEPNGAVVERGEYSILNDKKQFFSLTDGAVELKYTLPSDYNGTAEFIPQPSQFSAQLTMQIYNVQSGEWEEATTKSYELDPYVDEWNSIKIKLDSGNEYYEGILPMLLLDREVQP